MIKILKGIISMFIQDNFDSIFDDMREQYFTANDIYTMIKITKSQAKNDCTKQLSISRKINDQYIQEQEIIEIPRNIKNNTMLQLKEKGNKFSTSEKRGDLYIKIHIL